MQFERLVIDALAYDVPEESWTSEQIEAQLAPVYERLKLPEGRLELMTGITERRFYPRDLQASEASTRAGKKLLEKWGGDVASVDMLIHAAVCRDRLEPATAAYVHSALGFTSKTAFLDVSNACLGVLSALQLAGGMIESGQAKRVMVVAGENGRPLVEDTIALLNSGDFTRNSIKPYFANLTIGAGAVAMMLCAEDCATHEKALKLKGAVCRANSSVNELCQGDSQSGNGLLMETDSEALLVAGLGLAKETWDAFSEDFGDPEAFDRFISHQVGKRHRDQLFERLGISLEKDFSSFPTWGNVGSVSLPMTLAQYLEQRPEAAALERVALLGIGSGLSSMMLALEG